MPANLLIKARSTSLSSFIDVILRNDGDEDFPSGTLWGVAHMKDGTVESITMINSTTLEPGQTTKCQIRLNDPPRYRYITLQKYVPTSRSNYKDIAIRGVIKKKLFSGWYYD